MYRHLSEPRGSDGSTAQRVKVLKELCPSDSVDGDVFSETREEEREVHGRGGGGGRRETIS